RNMPSDALKTPRITMEDALAVCARIGHDTYPIARAARADRQRCRCLAEVARQPSREVSRRVARRFQKGHDNPDSCHLRPGPRGGPVAWLDRRPGAGAR